MRCDGAKQGVSAGLNPTTTVQRATCLQRETANWHHYDVGHAWFASIEATDPSRGLGIAGSRNNAQEDPFLYTPSFPFSQTNIFPAVHRAVKFHLGISSQPQPSRWASMRFSRYSPLSTALFNSSTIIILHHRTPQASDVATTKRTMTSSSPVPELSSSSARTTLPSSQAPPLSLSLRDTVPHTQLHPYRQPIASSSSHASFFSTIGGFLMSQVLRNFGALPRIRISHHDDNDVGGCPSYLCIFWFTHSSDEAFLRQSSKIEYRSAATNLLSSCDSTQFLERQ